MIEWALEHKEELGETARITLRQLDVSLMYWINRMQKETTPADELALYCLSKVYNRHVKVYTSSYCWTTLQDQFTLTQEEIGNLCDVHLLYMGPSKFAEIKRIQPPTPHSPSLPSHLPSPIVTPISNVTPSKGKRGQSKVTNRGDKQWKPSNISVLPSNKNKRNNKCNQSVMPVIPDKLETPRTSRSSQAAKRCSRYDMREHVFK